MLTKTFVLIIMNKIMLQQIVRNQKKRIIQMNNLDSIFDDDFDSVHIINELNSNYVNSNIDFDFE